MDQLKQEATMSDLVNAMNEMIAMVNALVKQHDEFAYKAKERDMTDDDARRIISGDLKDVKHKEAAKILGLSYGQVYAARKGITFKNVHEEAAQ